MRMLSTAAGEVVPWTSGRLVPEGADHNENVFIRIDVWAACHECLPSWVRNLSPQMETNVNSMLCERTTGLWDYETVTKPEGQFENKLGAAGKTCNTQMLEDVD